MTKSNQFKFDQSDFRGGINFNVEEAAPNQLFDSRDTWAPYGSLQSRPGIEPVSFDTYANYTATAVTHTFHYYDSSITTWTSGTTLPAALGGLNDVFYVGVNTLTVAPYLFRMNFTNTISNTADTQMNFEYWNGNYWAPLNVRNFSYMSSPLFSLRPTSSFMYTTEATPVAGTPAIVLAYTLPEDAALVIVNNDATANRYYIRCTLTNTAANITLNSGGTTVASKTLFSNSAVTNVSAVHYINKSIIDWADNSTSLLYSTLSPPSDLTVYLTDNMDSGVGVQTQTSLNFNTTFLQAFTSLAVMPPFNEAVFAIEWQAFIFKQSLTNIVNTSPTNAAYATVEDRPVFNGPGTDFDKAYIAQESVWPRMKFYAWHESTLFAFNEWENANAIRWSAFSDFNHVGYRIWPKISQDSIVSNDTSPITGACVFGEQLLVFKQNTLWRMVNEGVDVNGLNIYTPTQVYQGVGTITNDSIQVTPMGPLYATYDGVYAFDGVKSAKISRPIDKFWQEQVDFTKPELFKSGHWKKEHLYLLTVPTYSANSDYANVTLVFDYVNNAWWIWNVGNVVNWFCSANTAKDPAIYFLDYFGTTWTLNKNTNAYQGIDAWAQTHRFGYKENMSKDFTHFYINGENSMSSLQLEVISSDREDTDDLNTVFTDIKETATSVFKMLGALIPSTMRSTSRIRSVTVKSQYSGEWVQLKLTQNASFKQPMLVSQISVSGTYRPNI